MDLFDAFTNSFFIRICRYFHSSANELNKFLVSEKYNEPIFDYNRLLSDNQFFVTVMSSQFETPNLTTFSDKFVIFT